MTAPTTAPVRAHLINAGDLILGHNDVLYRVHREPSPVVGKHRDQVAIEVREADGAGGWQERSLSIVSYRRSTLRLVTGGA